MTHPFHAKRGAESIAKATIVPFGNRLICRCGGGLDDVKDSRPCVFGPKNETAIRRRRECSQCHQRATTLEVTEDFLLAYRAETLKEIALKIIAGEMQ